MCVRELCVASVRVCVRTPPFLLCARTRMCVLRVCVRVCVCTYVFVVLDGSCACVRVYNLQTPTPGKMYTILRSSVYDSDINERTDCTYGVAAENKQM